MLLEEMQAESLNGWDGSGSQEEKPY